MNMAARVMRAFALVAIATFLAASTGCDRNYRKKSAELKALLDTAQREYSARRWDLRKKAIAGVRAFFQGVDARDPAQFEKTKEYRMIGDFLATSSRDIYASVRIESLKAIAILRYEPAFDRVGEMALNDQDDNVRWQAVETLSLYRSEKSIDILTRTLRSDDWVIREASIRGMLMLDESVQRGRLIPYISEAMLDPNDNVSRLALAGTGIRDQQLYKTTADVFRARKKPSIKMLTALMRSLDGYILEDDIRKKVIDLLSHKDNKVRVLALRVLKKEKALEKKKRESRP